MTPDPHKTDPPPPPMTPCTVRAGPTRRRRAHPRGDRADRPARRAAPAPRARGARRGSRRGAAPHRRGPARAPARRDPRMGLRARAASSVRSSSATATTTPALRPAPAAQALHDRRRSERAAPGAHRPRRGRPRRDARRQPSRFCRSTSPAAAGSPAASAASCQTGGADGTTNDRAGRRTARPARNHLRRASPRLRPAPLRHASATRGRASPAARRSSSCRTSSPTSVAGPGSHPRRRRHPRPRCDDPTFHEFASEWFEGKPPRGSAAQRRGLPVGPRPPPAAVLQGPPPLPDHDRRGRSLQERKGPRARTGTKGRAALSNRSINETLNLLAQILEVAVEYGHIQFNPARGRRRRLKAPPPKRTWLEPEQIKPLLDATVRGLRGGRRCPTRGCARCSRPAICTGLRIGELLALRWQDVNLAQGRLTVLDQRPRPARTRDRHLARASRRAHRLQGRCPHPKPPDYVFATATGKPRPRSNVASRLKRAVARANEVLAARSSRADPVRSSRRTRCVAPSPRCSTSAARTPSTSCTRWATPTPSSRCASTRG